MGNKRGRGVRHTEYDRIARSAANYVTTEVPLYRAQIRPRLEVFDSERRQPLSSGAMPNNGEHPGEAVIREHLRFGIHRKQPSEPDAEFRPIKVVKYFLGRRQFFVPGHMLHSG